ncbi:MAG TPA: hypothetical protein VJ552_04265 [Sediminibacterium sp.]|nr:hypothetical protein [Sediminibacterium sp.]
MENNDALSARESLQLIESMIHKAQNRINENGTLYLLWGWVVFICSLGHYLMIKFAWIKQPAYIWALTWLVIIYQIIYISRKEKTEKVKTYTDEMIGYVWMAFGICMGIVTFIMYQLGTWGMLYSLILLFYGIPTFLSGAIMRFRPLIIGGICCWGLSMLSVFVQSVEIILFLIPAVLSAWIIPGYLLRARYKSAIA